MQPSESTLLHRYQWKEQQLGKVGSHHQSSELAAVVDIVGRFDFVTASAVDVEDIENSHTVAVVGRQVEDDFGLEVRTVGIGSRLVGRPVVVGTAVVEGTVAEGLGTGGESDAVPEEVPKGLTS